MLDAPAHLDAVEARHHHVEHDDHRVVRRHSLQGLVAVAGLEHLEVVGLEHGPHDAAHDVVVVDDEHEPARPLEPPAPAHRRSDSTLASPVL